MCASGSARSRARMDKSAPLVAQCSRCRRSPVWIIHTDSRIIHLSRRKRNYDGRAAAMLKSASRRNTEADTATHRIKAVHSVYYFTSPGGGRVLRLPRFVGARCLLYNLLQQYPSSSFSLSPPCRL